MNAITAPVLGKSDVAKIMRLMPQRNREDQKPEGTTPVNSAVASMSSVTGR